MVVKAFKPGNNYGLYGKAGFPDNKSTVVNSKTKVYMTQQYLNIVQSPDLFNTKKVEMAEKISTFFILTK